MKGLVERAKNKLRADGKYFYLDFETYSFIDIKTAGHHNYCRHYSFKILLSQYAIKDNQVRVLNHIKEVEGSEAYYDPNYIKLKKAIKKAVEDGYTFVAHNCSFERECLKAYGLLENGLENSDRWEDTMSIALQHRLPASLSGVASALGTTKLESGAWLIKKFSTPKILEFDTEEDLFEYGGHVLGSPSFVYIPSEDFTQAGIWKYIRLSDLSKQRVKDLEKPGVCFYTKKMVGRGKKKEEKVLFMPPVFMWSSIPEKNIEEDMLDFEKYGAQDINATRFIFKKLKGLNEFERRRFNETFKINDHGVRIDYDLAVAGDVLSKEIREQADKKCIDTCGFKTTQVAKVTQYLKEALNPYGITVDNMQSDTLEHVLSQHGEAIQGTDAETTIKCRLASNANAPQKFAAALLLSCWEDDNFIYHDIAVHHGAGTGRWTARGVQLQNLIRLRATPQTIQAVKTKELSMLEILGDFSEPLQSLASCVRPMLIPRDGYKFARVDKSQIEARITAWIAGQMDIVKAYANGEDVYIKQASKIFNIPEEEVTKDQRNSGGKVTTLAFGYGGGALAYQSMAKAYGLSVTLEEGERFKELFRRENPYIVRLWHKAEDAAKKALQYPGVAVKCKTPTTEMLFHYGLSGNSKKGDTSFLRIVLPSGRALCYFQPKFTGGEISYKVKKTRQELYGGNLVENIVQGWAADVFLDDLARASKMYNCCLIVHDEGVFEVPENESEEGYEFISSAFNEDSAYSPGLPIASDGEILDWYEKV